MKQIRINVPLTVTRETSDIIAEPVYGYGLPLQTSGRFFVRQTIDALCGAVRVTIVGDQQYVQEMLADQKNDPAALIQRALSALGYVIGDHKKDVEQFSRWVDHLASFPRSEEALALWTSAVLARLNSAEPPMIKDTLDEASETALRVVMQRMRLFPPAPKTGLDNGPPITWDRVKIVGMDLGTEAWSELQEWRTAAKQRGWESPQAMRGHSALDDAELDAWREAVTACGIKSPAELASMKDANFGQFVDGKITREWRSATDCLTPAQAKSKIEGLSFVKERADQVEQREQAWCDATGKTCPGDAQQRIEDLQMQVKMQADTIRRHEREISEWKKATGASDPDGAIARARADLDAWQEATGTANSHQAYKKIHDLEAKLLSYAGEIDALRKSPTRDVVTEMRACDAEHEKRITAERELAKVRAELDSKRRECQTERERADENARTMTARGVLLDTIADAIGVNFNHDSLPEHVADLKRAYEKLDIGQVTPEERERERTELVEIISSHMSNAGIESAASSIANRYAYLSAALVKTMQARDILLASPGEGIVNVAKRVMDRCANLEQQIIADDNRIDELRKILRAKEGESIVDAAKRSFVPLPKPEKVEAGQRWARINSISFVGWWGVIERATIGGEQPTTLELRSNSDWVYLGT